MTASKEKTKVEKPKREGDARREGKKNVSWRDDPEILQRLADVAVLMNKNFRAFQIARETKVSIETARRDISRVRELWKEDARDRIDNAKDIALAQYGAVIEQAWADMKKASAKSATRPAYMNIILKAQSGINDVTGIAKRVEHSGPGGGPIEVKPIDVEKIRKKRWEQVAPGLAEIANKEPNGITDANADKNP